MNDPNSQTEKPKDERRYNHWQYKFLRLCSERGDQGIERWNNWRRKKNNRNADIELEVSPFGKCYLRDVHLARTGGINEGESASGDDWKKFGSEVHLKEAQSERANLKGAALSGADMRQTLLSFAHLEGVDLSEADLRGANCQRVVVDGETSLWECKVDRETNFLGVSLDVAKIDPGTKQLLEYNIRRMKWEEWYKEHCILRWPVCWFWSLSDYGLRTFRIILWFFGLAFGFALVYWLWPSSVIVNGTIGDIRGLWHAVYFSVVTMTTLGFGDIAANPDSWLGQTLLMFQVILGYVLLGALITRFAVLFTAGGPAGKFADDKGQKTDDGRQNDKN